MKPGFWTRFTKQRNGRVRHIVYRLNRDNLVLVKPAIDATWTWVTKENYETATLFDEATIKKFGQLLDNGDIGLFGIVNGRPVGYYFAIIGKGTTPRAVNDLVSIKQGQAYIHYGHTHENYRGKRIMGFLMSTLAQHLLTERNLDVVYFDVAEVNTSSRRGAAKMGSQPVRVGTRLLFLGKELTLKLKEVA